MQALFSGNTRSERYCRALRAMEGFYESEWGGVHICWPPCALEGRQASSDLAWLGFPCCVQLTAGNS